MLRLRAFPIVLLFMIAAAPLLAQSSPVAGTVRDETGGTLPGVVVELRGESGAPQLATTDAQGAYHFDKAAPGRAQVPTCR